MTVTKRGPFLSDVAQTCLEIETHPNVREVWIRVLSESGNKTFRCSPELAIEIYGQLLAAVDSAFGHWLGEDAP